MKGRSAKTVPINWIGDTERYILVPRLVRNRVVKRPKRLVKVKGNCYFTLGVAHGLIDFVYRAVTRLGLRDRKLIFSRGSVKSRGRPTSNMVEVLELDWDLGTSIIIPLKRNYRDRLDFVVAGKKHSLRLMEIMTLSGLMRLTHPGKSELWRSARAAAILARGWKELERPAPPTVRRGR